MRKKEFLAALTKNCPNLSEEQVNRMSNRIINALVTTMRNGGRAEIRGFGTFFVRDCKSRLLRNPRTGEMIEIPARRIPRFKAGKELKEKVNRADDNPSHRS